MRKYAIIITIIILLGILAVFISNGREEISDKLDVIASTFRNNSNKISAKSSVSSENKGIVPVQPEDKEAFPVISDVKEEDPMPGTEEPQIIATPTPRPQSDDYYKYDFESIEEKPEFTGNEDEPYVFAFQPVEIQKDSWLYELSGGQEIKVTIGYLYISGGMAERYIDITGVNGSVRYLQNSYSLRTYGSKTQLWSAKQQEGNSIVKDFSKEIFSVVLFEQRDGTKYIVGYTEGSQGSFWNMDIPTTNYFIYSK